MFKSTVVFLISLLLFAIGISLFNGEATTSASAPATGFWNQATNLPRSLADSYATMIDNHIFVLGGKNRDRQPTDKIYSAFPNLDGSIDQWSEMGNLPTPLYTHAVAAYGRNIYVIGGYNGQAPQTKIWRARYINDSMSSWQVVGELDEPRTLHDAVVARGFLYIVGGLKGVNYVPSNQIDIYQILSNGNLGDKKTFIMPKALARVKALVHHGYLYVIGGYDGQKRSKKIYYAKLKPDGGIDTDFGVNGWLAVSFPNGAAREYAQAVVHDGELWVLGGRDANGEPQSTIFIAVFGEEGSLEWKNEPNITLPRSLYRFGLVAVPFRDTDYLYLIGGLSGDTPAYRNEVYFSKPPSPITVPYLPLVINDFSPPPPGTNLSR